MANLIYSPSFIAMGSVQEDLQDPDLVIIGTKCGLAHSIHICAVKWVMVVHAILGTTLHCALSPSASTSATTSSAPYLTVGRSKRKILLPSPSRLVDR